MICENLLSFRRLHKLTQEDIAGKLGVSRQARIVRCCPGCMALASLYDVALDD